MRIAKVAYQLDLSEFPKVAYYHRLTMTNLKRFFLEKCFQSISLFYNYLWPRQPLWPQLIISLSLEP